MVLICYQFYKKFVNHSIELLKSVNDIRLFNQFLLIHTSASGAGMGNSPFLRRDLVSLRRDWDHVVKSRDELTPGLRSS